MVSNRTQGRGDDQWQVSQRQPRLAAYDGDDTHSDRRSLEDELELETRKIAYLSSSFVPNSNLEVPVP